MSVLIKDMEMPSNCNDCDIDFCIFKYEARDDIGKTRSDHCPLVEVPTPHGRLIDADVLKEDAVVCLFGVARVTDIDKQPTILESEVEE